MSAELQDIGKQKVTEETIAWLRAEARSTGKSHQEIVRETLHQIAVEQIRKAKVLVALAPREGSARENQ